MGVPASHGSAEPLWRAIAVFRFASLGYAAAADHPQPGRLRAARLGVRGHRGDGGVDGRYYRGLRAPGAPDPGGARRRPRGHPGLLLSTLALQYPQAMRHGVMPVTAIWVAGPVLAWAVGSAGGRARSPPWSCPAATSRCGTGTSPWSSTAWCSCCSRAGPSATWPGWPPRWRPNASTPSGRGDQPGTGTAGPRHPRLGAAGTGAGAAARGRGGRRGGRARPPGGPAGGLRAARAGGRRSPGRPPGPGDDVDLVPSSCGPGGGGDGIGASPGRSAGKEAAWSWPRRSGRRWTTCGGTAASGSAPGCWSRTSRGWSR